MNRRIFSQKTQKYTMQRVEECSEFTARIPNTTLKEYNDQNVKLLNDQFDMFITGSDQVWNPNWFFEPYYLTFTEKRKISYAASIAVSRLTEAQEELIINKIRDINYISEEKKQQNHYFICT